MQGVCRHWVKPSYYNLHCAWSLIRELATAVHWGHTEVHYSWVSVFAKQEEMAANDSLWGMGEYKLTPTLLHCQLSLAVVQQPFLLSCWCNCDKHWLKWLWSWELGWEGKTNFKQWFLEKPFWKWPKSDRVILQLSPTKCAKQAQTPQELSVVYALLSKCCCHMKKTLENPAYCTFLKQHFNTFPQALLL